MKILVMVITSVVLIGCDVRVEKQQLENASNLCKEGISYLNVRGGGGVWVTCVDGMSFPVSAWEEK